MSDFSCFDRLMFDVEPVTYNYILELWLDVHLTPDEIAARTIYRADQIADILCFAVAKGEI